MRKVFVIGLAVLCISLMAACGSRTKAPTPAGLPSVKVSEDTAQSSQAPDTGSIIAESSNTVSDKEKESILNELSDELNGTIGSTDSLEDLSDSDLDTSNID